MSIRTAQRTPPSPPKPPVQETRRVAKRQPPPPPKSEPPKSEPPKTAPPKTEPPKSETRAQPTGPVPKLPDDTIRIDRKVGSAAPTAPAPEPPNRAAHLPTYKDQFDDLRRTKPFEVIKAPKGDKRSHITTDQRVAPSIDEVYASMRRRYDDAARDLSPRDRFTLARDYSERLNGTGRVEDHNFADRLRTDEANYFRRLAQDPRNAARTMIDDFPAFEAATRAQPGFVTRTGLEAVRAGDYRPELKSAAAHVLDTPGLFDKIDDAAGILGRNDGIIGKDDLRAFWSKQPAPDPAATAKRAELTRYADDLMVRPSSAADLDYLKSLQWRGISFREGQASLRMIDQMKPADHASYDLKTNIRRGDEHYFLSDAEVGKLFNADAAMKKFTVADLGLIPKAGSVEDGRLLYKSAGADLFDPQYTDLKLFDPKLADWKHGDKKRVEVVGKRQTVDSFGFPRLPFDDFKDSFGLPGMRGFKDRTLPDPKLPGADWIPPDPKHKAAWLDVLNAHPEVRPLLMSRPETADAVIERHLVATDPRFKDPRDKWSKDTQDLFTKEKERLNLEDLRRKRILDGDPIARMRGEPGSWNADQQRIAQDHQFAYDMRRVEGKIRPEFERLEAEYKKHKWGPDSPYYGADNALFMMDLARKDQATISRYDAWRGLGVAEDYRKANPKIFEATPDSFRGRQANNPIYYRDLEEIRAKNLPDFADIEKAIKADPNNPLLYLRNKEGDLTDPQRDRVVQDYSRYAIERFEGMMRARTVAGLGEDVDKLLPHFGKMLEERGLVEKGVDYLRTHIGSDGAVMLDSRISSDAVGKTIDEALKARYAVSNLRNFQGTPEEFRKAYRERLDAMQDKLVQSKMRMEEFKHGNEAWREGIADVVATIAGVGAAAAAPFTLGGSLLVGAAVGALTKVTWKGLDSLESSAPYTSWPTDAFTGAVSGATGAGSGWAAGKATNFMLQRAGVGLGAGETLPFATRAGAFVGPRIPIGAVDGFVSQAGNAAIKGEKDPLEKGLYGAAFGMVLFPVGDGAIASVKSLRKSLFGKSLLNEGEAKAKGFEDAFLGGAPGRTKEQAKELFDIAGGRRFDEIKFSPADEIAPTIERAILHAEQTGQNTMVIRGAMRNLSGINKTLNGHSAANEVYGEAAVIVRTELERAGARVSAFRDGADATYVVSGELNRDAVKAAMLRAEKQIDDMLKRRGLSEIPHPKHPDDPAWKGSGMTLADTVVVRGDTIQTIEKRLKDGLVALETKLGQVRPPAATYELRPADKPAGAPEPADVVRAPGQPKFLDPIDYRRQQFIERAKTFGVGEDEARRLFKATGGEKLDPDVGWHLPDHHVPTVQRAVDHVRATGDDGFYVEMDIRNLGALNASFGRPGAVTEFKMAADLIKEELRAIKADVSFFHHGGDEVSAVIVGPGVARETIDAAMTRALQRFRAYGKTRGLSEIPHSKHPGDPSQNGVGIAWGISRIGPNETPDAIFKRADVLVELMKAGGKK